MGLLLLFSRLCVFSAPPGNVRISPSTLYTAAFFAGFVHETFTFTCTADGGPTLRYSWEEVDGIFATNLTAQPPGLNGKTANGSLLTITAQNIMVTPTTVRCTAVNPIIPPSNPARQGQATTSYNIYGENSCFIHQYQATL